jgi:deoxyribose-phosphate aldolase
VKKNKNLEEYIDYTLLKNSATKKDIIKLCEKAKENKFKAVCVNPCRISLAIDLLKGSSVLVVGVVGFPLGANTTKIKKLEAREIIKMGCDELDMVINIGKLVDGDYQYVFDEINTIMNETKNSKTKVKIILETSTLNCDLIIDASILCCLAKVEYIKTSTGIFGEGATIENVKLIKQVVGSKVKIKASGGIKTKEDAIKFINAGADRIGTSNEIKN